MVERRSLGAALTIDSEKLAFIHGEPAPSEKGRGAGRAPLSDISHRDEQRASLDPADATDDSDSEPSEPELDKRQSRPRRRRVPGGSRAAQEFIDFDDSLDLPPIRVSLTTRLSPAIAEALRRATLEQRLKRRRPHTQQEIVEAAVRHWLESYGFFAAPTGKNNLT